MGAIGSIIGALLANKIKAGVYNLLILLALTGVGVFMMGLPLPTFLSFSGNLVCELFMTIFNIHFFTQVQTKVEGEYLGRVLSTIFTFSHPIYADCKRLYDSATKCPYLFFSDNWKRGYCPVLSIPRLCAKSF